MAHEEEKGWVVPSSAALIALSVASAAFFALLTGRVSAGALPLIATFLIGGFVPQFTAGLIAAKEREATTANVMIYFGSFFMLASGLELFIEYYGHVSGWELDPGIDGYVWLILALALWGWTPAYFKGVPGIMPTMLIFFDIALMCIAIGDFGVLTNILHNIGGWFILFGGLLGLYVGWAGVLAAVYKRPVLPLGQPWLK